MKRHRFLTTLFALSIYLIAYVISIIFKSEFWGDILSPFGELLSFSIIFNTYLKSSQTHLLKNIWILLSLASLSWAVADILWALDDLVLRRNPENNYFITYLYMGANISFFLAVTIYSIYVFKKWNSIQLIIDSIAISVSSLLLIWILYFNKNFNIFELINQDGFMYIIGITLDVSIFIVMAVLYFSIRSGKIPKYIGITAGAILLYVLTDICWMYLYYKNLYIPNSLIDVLYLASLLGIAAGAKLKAVSNIESPSLQESESSNVGFKHKGFLLLIYPVLVLIFKGLVFTDLLVFVFIILVHKWLSAYIQVAIKNEQLLKREKDLNVDLESRISERMKDIVEKNEKLDFLSNHDMLTILYNRRYFIRGLEEMILQVAPNETLALLFLDIDRFKTINDTYGHHVGDQILIVISQRLQNLELQNSLLARLGGDEFVLAFHSNYGYQKTEEIAQQIIRCCKEVIIIERYSFHITVSMGISIYPFDAQDCETLMKNADIAMYQAKKQGYNKYVSFNEQLNNVIRRKNEIEILLKDADLDKEFELFYQPQFSIPEKKLIGMEALLRWNKPGKGVILPGEFISIAEETDDIIPIGNWVMKKAIGQIANWNNSYGLKLKMGINVSPKQMDQTVFISKLKSEMEDFLIKPEWLDVEITEGVAIEGEYKIAEIAKQFKNIGVSISIDDFGTGYSSLSRLKNIPFDRIKIAKPLIDAITTNSYDMEIIKHTISLAKSIGIKTIAEGVELQDQFDLLVDLGCEEIQGYILGKPMPALEFEKTFIETRNYYQTNTKFTKKAAHSL